MRLRVLCVLYCVRTFVSLCERPQSLRHDSCPAVQAYLTEFRRAACRCSLHAGCARISRTRGTDSMCSPSASTLPDSWPACGTCRTLANGCVRVCVCAHACVCACVYVRASFYAPFRLVHHITRFPLRQRGMHNAEVVQDDILLHGAVLVAAADAVLRCQQAPRPKDHHDVEHAAGRLYICVSAARVSPW